MRISSSINKSASKFTSNSKNYHKVTIKMYLSNNRYALQNLCLEPDENIGGPIERFIKSLKNFYLSILQTNNEIDCPVRTFQGLQVRAELFKLNYDSNEFVLHDKADAFQALEKILGIIHGWSLKPRQKDIKIFDLVEKKCYGQCQVHLGFYQQLIKQRICICGKEDKIEMSNENQFAMTINTIDVLTILDLVRTETKSELSKIVQAHQGLMYVLQTKLVDEQKNQCVSSEIKGSNHKASTRHALQTGPEIFAFNLQWNGEPNPRKILKMMLSIPESFQTNEIFKETAEQFNFNYEFKGMFCLKGSNYLSFFKRIPIKMQYIVQQDQHWQAYCQKMFGEAALDSEWTLFDDSVVIKKGPWQ